MSGACTISVRRGALHLARDVYEACFLGLENVVLLRDSAALIVVPVHHTASGGYVIKVRNGQGDRVVMAADFFRACGIDDAQELTLAAAWSEERAALIAADAFVLVT